MPSRWLADLCRDPHKTAISPDHARTGSLRVRPWGMGVRKCCATKQFPRHYRTMPSERQATGWPGQTDMVQSHTGSNEEINQVPLTLVRPTRTALAVNTGSDLSLLVVV